MSRHSLFIALVLTLSAAGPVSAQVGSGQATPAAPATSQPDYRLGPGDEFRVIVQNHENLSGDYMVPEGGLVVFPEIGSTKVQGLSLPELTHTLTKKLNEILVDPNVTVVLKAQRARFVTVIGDVQHPMPVPYLPSMRLEDVVTAAGGLTLDVKPAECEVDLTHEGTTRTVEFTELLADPTKNYPVQPGDTVNVDAGTFTVYVVGQVRNPGLQRLKRGSGLLQAVASAGGPTDSGAIDHMQLVRLDGSRQEVDITPAFVHGQDEKLPQLRSGDVVTVPVSTSKFYILGYVGVPGLYQIPPGQSLTLAEALSLARGQDAERRGRYGRVLITRKENGQSKTYSYDFAKFIQKGDPSGNPTIMAGDMVYVPETNKVSPLTASSAIASLASLLLILRY